MWSYDSIHFDPSAPVANVTLRKMQSGVTVSGVLLLVDSGADLTLLPRTAIRSLGVTPLAATVYELIAFDGSTSVSEAVTLELNFLGKNVRGQFLLIDQGFGVLGRDILNHLKVMMDGPEQKWSELK